MDLIFVRLIDMEVPGVTVLDENGDYNMYINARLTYEQRLKTYNHEIKHINLGHFYDNKSVTENEREAG